MKALAMLFCIPLGVVAMLGLMSYLAACMGGQRWLTFREWWGYSYTKSTDAHDVPKTDQRQVREGMAMADPEFGDTARAALLWVLWHHQGGSSPTGQAVRFALGMGQFDRLTPSQVAQAKSWASGIPGLAHTDACGVRPSDEALPFDREYVHGYLSEVLRKTVSATKDPHITALMDWLDAVANGVPGGEVKP